MSNQNDTAVLEGLPEDLQRRFKAAQTTQDALNEKAVQGRFRKEHFESNMKRHAQESHDKYGVPVEQLPEYVTENRPRTIAAMEEYIAQVEANQQNYEEISRSRAEASAE